MVSVLLLTLLFQEPNTIEAPVSEIYARVSRRLERVCGGLDETTVRALKERAASQHTKGLDRPTIIRDARAVSLNT